MSTARTVDAYMEELRREFPGARILPKSGSQLMRAIDVFLRVVSFGRANKFLTGYHTTLGTTVYTGEKWGEKSEIDRVVTLRHEAVHMRQAKRLGRVCFSFLYLFAWFPVGLARFRARFEMEAYEETVRAVGQLRGAAAVGRIDKEKIVRHFTSADYLWAWPFRKSVEAWFDAVVKKVLIELSQSKEQSK